eukprot:sb/3474748/
MPKVPGGFAGLAAGLARKRQEPEEKQPAPAEENLENGKGLVNPPKIPKASGGFAGLAAGLVRKSSQGDKIGTLPSTTDSISNIAATAPQNPRQAWRRISDLLKSLDDVQQRPATLGIGDPASHRGEKVKIKVAG